MSGSRALGTGRFLAGAGAGFLLLALSAEPSWAAGPRGAARGMMAPMAAVTEHGAAAASSAASLAAQAAALHAENGRLGRENAELRRQIAELGAAGSENEGLRRALDFQRGFGHRTVAASVIGRGPDPYTPSLIVDRGTGSGVRPGMVVVTGAGLVGRVRECGPGTATVQTVADPASGVNAYTPGSGLEGTVRGGLRTLRMTVGARPGVEASAGEWVLTSGLGAGFPRGIPVGRVNGFRHRDSATSAEVELAWVNELGAISAVLVVSDFLPR